jgi:hypothetical protein
MLRKFFRRITTSRYACSLEDALAHERATFAQQRAEIDRLRTENRALLNSILGIAGVPPLPATEADLASDFCTAGLRPAQLTSSFAPANQTNSKTPAGGQRYKNPIANAAPHVAAPMRRRSWPQIHRLLEFESAQKEKPAADPLPPAF